MPPPSQRRSDRISIELPIEVIGYDADGSHFIQEGHTRLISRHGGLIVLKRKLPPEAELILVNTQLKDQAAVRVVGHAESEPDGEVYGVAFLDANKSLWRVAFPPMDEAEAALARVLLHCAGCHSQEVVHFTEVDMEIFASKQELIRSCKSCSRATVWKQLGPETTSATAPIATAEPESRHEQSPIEKRRHPRKKVKLLACIRQSGREHVVDCDDVSRGGFCFKGYRKYVVDMEIDVAMPYTRGGGNIFLPARIAHCKAGAAGVFKCGVAYKQKS